MSKRIALMLLDLVASKLRKDTIYAIQCMFGLNSILSLSHAKPQPNTFPVNYSATERVVRKAKPQKAEIDILQKIL